MTEVERQMIEIAAPLEPRWIASENVWAFVYDNEFDREVERYGSKDECIAAIRALKDKPS